MNYSSVTIDKNRYEELEREDAEARLNRRQRDIEYADASGASDQRVRMEELAARERMAIDVNREVAGIDLDASVAARRAEVAHGEAMRGIGFREEEETREMERVGRLELMEKYHEQEKARILADMEVSDRDKDARVAEIDLRIDQIRLQIERGRYEFESMKAEDEARRQRELRQFETTLEIDRKAREADILIRLSQREDDLREKRQDHSHEEAMAGIEADVTKATIANDGDRIRAEGEAKAARAELEGFKQANEVAHRQNMDNAAMTERMIQAASGRAEDRRIVCPRCGTSLDPRARFCTGCGSKLRED